MPKIAEDLQKHTFLLRSGDVEKLRDAYPDVPVSLVIRRLISSVVDRFEKGEPKLDLEVRI